MDEYIQELLRDAGIPESTDPEVKAQLAKDLAERATDLMNRRIVDAMSEEDVLAFEKILDEQPEDVNAMQQFIDEHVPNKNQVIGSALLEFRALYLGNKA